MVKLSIGGIAVSVNKINIVGENILKKRKIAGLSQESLAEKLNVSCETISSWENGSSEPNIDMIIRLSQTFNISIEDLIHEKCKSTRSSQIPYGKCLIGTYFGFIFIMYLGAWFQFFPFNLIFNGWEGNIVIFGLLIISILIVICTCIIIEEIHDLKKGDKPIR
nr:helix-turn-helix transcriptional regulator [Alkalibaculum sporogenes]